MNKPDSPTQEPHIQFLVACPRSGSTLLIGIFAQFPVCELTSRLILTSKMDEGDGFGPNNSILQEPSHYDVYIGAKEFGKRFFIRKKNLGMIVTGGIVYTIYAPVPPHMPWSDQYS